MTTSISHIPLLVVLDIDQTLIYSSKRSPSRHSDIPVKEVHFENNVFLTQKRPGVDLFLQKLFNDSRFVPAVWTTASEDYAEYILTNLGIDLGKLHFLFSNKHCASSVVSLGEGHSSFGVTRYIKDLRKAVKHHPWPLTRVIAVDDLASVYSRQYSNLLLAPEFKGTETSPEFFERLWNYLVFLSELDNVRPHDKRGWLRSHLR